MTKTVNMCFENVTQFKLLAVAVTKPSLIQEELEICQCYNSVQNRLLSKNVNITFYITIILPVVLYGCETWSLTESNLY
jgi:hypothetical protein